MFSKGAEEMDPEMKLLLCKPKDQRSDNQCPPMMLWRLVGYLELAFGSKDKGSLVKAG